eukprot:scaffold131236_cov10-Tisochrysis_lutea.AAC.1
MEVMQLLHVCLLEFSCEMGTRTLLDLHSWMQATLPYIIVIVAEVFHKRTSLPDLHGNSGI